MVLLISYDLNGHERPSAYTDVKNAIERNAIAFRRPLFSQWFVETNDGAEAWSDRLRRVMDDDDSLFIVQVRRPYQGWLDKPIWQWLDVRI